MIENWPIPLLASGLAFLSVLLVCASLRGYFHEAGKVDRLRAKLAGVLGAEEQKRGAGRALAAMARHLADLFRRLGERMGPRETEGLDRNRLALIQAGVRSPNAHLVFQGVKAALALIPAGVLLAVRLAFPQILSMQAATILVLLLALLGCYAPDYWLRARTATRKNALLCELPDALDLLVVCVESGMGLDQAIQRVSEELRQNARIISEELRTMTLELRAGRQRQQCLKDLALRTGLEDVNSLTTLLIQADVFGTSVAKTLRVYSETLRGSRFQRAEEKAAKLPTKLLFPLVLCIFPALFVVIMGPAAIQLMQVFAQMPR